MAEKTPTIDERVERIRETRELAAQAVAKKKEKSAQKRELTNDEDGKGLVVGAPSILYKNERPYSYGKAMFGVRFQEWEAGSPEREAHERLVEEMGLRETPEALLRQGRILVPWNTRVTSTTTASALIQPEFSNEIIELLRSRLILRDLGVRDDLTLPAGGLDLPRQTGDVTAYWVGEATDLSANASDLTLGDLQLRPKKLTAYSIVNNEALRGANPGLEQLLRTSFAEKMARKEQEAFFLGAGTTNEPRGLINDPDVIIDNSAFNLGTNGGTPTANTLLNMMQVFEDNLGDLNRSAWASAPRTKYTIAKQRSDSGAGAGTGPYLWQPDLVNKLVPEFRGISLFTTTEIPVNLTKGTSSDTTILVLGQFENGVIARSAGLEISVSTDRHFDTDQTDFKAISYLDMGVLQPKTFVIAKGVRP